jgi:hypothetical protein
MDAMTIASAEFPEASSAFPADDRLPLNGEAQVLFSRDAAVNWNWP